MVKTDRSVLLIASDEGIHSTIGAILQADSSMPGLLPQTSFYQVSTVDEALAAYSQLNFALILLEDSPLPAIKRLRAVFVNVPIVLIIEAEREKAVTEWIHIPSVRVQDYLLREELTAGIVRRLLRPAHLYVEKRRQLDEMVVLNKVAAIGSAATNIEELLTEVTRLIAGKLYVHHFGFIMRDENGRWRPHEPYHSLNPVQLPTLSDDLPGIVGWVARHGRPRRIADVTVEPDYLPIDPHTIAELCVPLIIRGETVGVINAESDQQDGFSESDERLLMTLARQMATVIEKIKLLEAERRRRHEAETLRDITTTLAATLDPNQVLEQILLQLDKVIPNDSACVTLLQDSCLQIRATHGFADPASLLDFCYPASDPFFQEVKRTKRPMCLPDARAHPDFQQWGDADHIRGWICAPLIIHDKVLGILTVDNNEPDAYDADDVALAQAFANQAALAIENARLYEAEQQRRHTAEILRAANEALTQTLDQDMVLQTLITYLVQIVPVDSVSVLLLDESGERVRLHSAWGFERWVDKTAVSDIRIHIRQNLTLAPVFSQGQTILIADTALDERWERFPQTSYVRSWLGVPIFSEGKVIGAFSLDKATPHFFTAEHVRLVQTITAQATVALQNARLFTETEQRATELEIVTEISAKLRLAETVDKTVSILVQEAKNIFEGVFSSIYLLESESGDLVLRRTLPFDPNLIGHRHKLGEGITGHVALSGQPYICRDIWDDPLFKPFATPPGYLKSVRANISVPLQSKSRVIGVIHVSVEQSHEFSRAEINLLTAVSEIGASALERAMLLETLEQRVSQRTRQLAEAYEQLQELDRLKTKFVSDVSHELRTPITNLSLYVDLLAQGKPERQAHYQNILRQQVNRLNTLIEDTLHISRLDMGKIQMRREPVDLNMLVQMCVADLRLLAERSGQVTLTAVLHPHLPLVSGDKEQLYTVMQNLIKNAIDYTSQGNIDIATTFEAVSRQVCLQVADTGMGIAPTDLPHLFERFYRGTAVSQSTLPGTGLGLAIAKEIIDRHQGSIHVESEVGVGSLFTVCLPQAE